MNYRLPLAGIAFVCALFSCSSTPGGAADSPASGRAEWAIAIHGGAGVISKDGNPDEIAAAKQGLREALSIGREMLRRGESALDTVEAVVVALENNPAFNAGYGAVYTAEGKHELDSSIMSGADLGCGGVTGVVTVKNPIRLARRVMEGSPHVLFGGQGAEAFADTHPDIERVQNSSFDTERRRKSLERWLEEKGLELPAHLVPAPEPELETEAEAEGSTPVYVQAADVNQWKSTVGCVVLDKEGNLAAGTSTGGMTGKRFGRIGDSPLIGAGTYANNDTCAVSCTGTGEEYIRHGVARDIADRMRYSGKTAQAAAEAVVFEVLQPGDGGVIVVGRDGSIALVFNTLGMFRGAANSEGRFDIGIWE